MSDPKNASPPSTGSQSPQDPPLSPSKRESSLYIPDIRDNDKPGAFGKLLDSQLKAIDSAAVLYTLLKLDADLVSCSYCDKETHRNSNLTLIQGKPRRGQSPTQRPLFESVFCSNRCMDEFSGFSSSDEEYNYPRSGR